jgi:hypothetical protein
MNMMVVATEQNPARLGSTVQAVRLQVNHRLNMELHLQSLFGLHVQCAQLYSLAETPQLPPPLSDYLGSFMRTLLVSQDRRHLFVTLLGEPFLESKF